MKSKFVSVVPPQLSHFDFGEDSINSGDSVSLSCNAHKGDRPIKISWFLNNNTIDGVQGITSTKIGQKGSGLNIDPVQDIHAGRYTCVAVNKAGVATYSAELHVNGIATVTFIKSTLSLYMLLKPIPILPHISPFESGEDSINYGESVSMTCNVHKGDLPVEITWYLNNKTLHGSSDTSIVKTGKKTSALTIDSVKDHHAGIYTCRAQNRAGFTAYSTELHVNVPPQLTHFDFGEESIYSGDSVSLNCNAHKGDRPIKISWFLNNNTIEGMQGITSTKIGQKGSALNIDPVQDSHAGRYTCVAVNEAGVATYSAELHVNVLPHIAPFDSGEDTINYGESVSMTCNVHKGDLPVEITWYLNNKTLHDSNDFSIVKAGKKTSALTIDSVADHHAGVYTCRAQNRAGYTVFSTELHVNGIRAICL
ncbi:hypothetical protein HHI36_009354 [Cryptolaemus montrouzieri]|uniref:Ig-like domain-containing protein n=1 Tax=Cryptolaemus montrouzieri TaxID=559131 RepID=A0ABD2MUZ4_9CUCU